jgi:hypothetical protein
MLEIGIDSDRLPPARAQDGGVLAMNTYGHLRGEREAAMAEKVRF